MRKLESTILAVLATTASASALGEVTVYSGAPGVPGQVQSYDEVTGAPATAPAELAAVELLPFELAGRNVLEEFLPDKARRIEDVPGASRLELQNRRGSLYHYVRDTGAGRAFGYFIVSRAGAPRVVIERPGVGLGGAQSPFVDRVAVAPDGQALLFATQIAGGGNLLEVDISQDPAVVVDRTSAAPPVRIGSRGLALTATHVWALTGRGIVRGSRVGTADVQLVNYGPNPAPHYYQGDLVTSEHGTAVAYHAGTGANDLDTWTATDTGPARRASTAPGASTNAGFLPQAVDGPYLAVSDDGTWAAWRSEFVGPVANFRDCIVSRSAAPIGEQQENLTSDQRFTDTLDEVAVFYFGGPLQVVFGVGEQGATPGAGIEGVDLFRADLTPGGTPTITNLSGTSNDFTLPFLGIPTLKPSRWVLSPDRRSLLLHDDQGSHGDVFVVDTATGAAVTVVSDVKTFDWVELAGQRFAFGLQRGSGQKRNEIYSLPADLSGAATLSFSSPDGEPTRSTAARAGGLVAWLRQVGVNQILERVRVPDTTVETWGPVGPTSAPQTWTPGGSLTFQDANAVWIWPVAGGTPTSFAPGGAFQVLPGA